MRQENVILRIQRICKLGCQKMCYSEKGKQRGEMQMKGTSDMGTSVKKKENNMCMISNAPDFRRLQVTSHRSIRPN